MPQRPSISLLLITTCLLLNIHSVFAVQLQFKTTKNSDNMVFHYKWNDHQEQQHELDFSIPLEHINSQYHKRFVPQLADQYVYISLHRAAQKIDPKEASVRIHREGKDIRIRVNSRSEALIHKWQRLMTESQNQAFEQYLQDNYYSHFSNHVGQQAIKPDHLRYIAEGKSPLLPVAQALYEKVPENSETRMYINLLLSWIQSIPYNALEDRLTSNGAGFFPPALVVANNIGDCDSKSVLMASLIRSLLPDTKMVMIYLPNHALLGISLPFRNAERTLDIDGTHYLLMEPTGPAAIKLGQIGPSSERAISGNMYSFEVIP